MAQNKKMKRYRGNSDSQTQKKDGFAEDAFGADTGDSFKEEDTSGFTASKKLKRKEKQAKKAESNLQKAKEKLPVKKEYALQRVFDEKTGKGK